MVYETLEFVRREMTSPEGSFYSALDADSEGEEGKYYVWKKEDLQQILENDFDLFAETMGYSGSPSFVVNNSEYEKIFSSTLSQTINDYIQDHYNGNCQNEKCVKCY